MSYGILTKNDKILVGPNGIRTGTAGSGCGCCYRQARKCSDNSMVDVWMTSANAATITGAFIITAGDGTCYYFNFSDPLGTPGTIYALTDVTTYASCTACGGGAPCTCPDGLCTNYRVVFDVTTTTYPGANGDCVGTPSSTCSATNATISMANFSDCIWHGEGGSCLVQQPALSLNTTSTPCQWEVLFSFAGLDTRKAIKTTGATPEGTYSDITGWCQFDGTNFVAISITKVRVECDDAP